MYVCMNECVTLWTLWPWFGFSILGCFPGFTSCERPCFYSLPFPFSFSFSLLPPPWKFGPPFPAHQILIIANQIQSQIASRLVRQDGHLQNMRPVMGLSNNNTKIQLEREAREQSVLVGSFKVDDSVTCLSCCSCWCWVLEALTYCRLCSSLDPPTCHTQHLAANDVLESWAWVNLGYHPSTKG